MEKELTIEEKYNCIIDFVKAYLMNQLILKIDGDGYDYEAVAYLEELLNEIEPNILAQAQKDAQKGILHTFVLNEGD